MPPEKKWVPIGKILREWGVRGQAKCVSFNPQSDIYSRVKKVYLESAGNYRPLDIQGAKPHGNFWLIQFSGYENPERVRELRGQEMLVPRDQLPALKPGEIYVSDLEGLEAFSPGGKSLGRIQGFNFIGESQVMLVGRGPKETVMVPYESEFIQSTSMEQKKIILTDYAMELFTMDQRQTTNDK